MEYKNILPARFLSRPNRFIAHIEIDNREEICHVKNTGRCRELLIPGTSILVQHCPSPQRKTAYDLISVWKGPRLINMDSAAPNRVFQEWALHGGLGFIPDILRPEAVCGDSRFDFYLEGAGQRGYAEIKGVTLEKDGVAMFPDAPTQRGAKHLRGLIECVHQGYAAWVVLVIQMQGMKLFRPNTATDPLFSQQLKEAAAAGVSILAVECQVSDTTIEICGNVPIDI